VFLVVEATWAITMKTCRNQRLALRIFPLRRLPLLYTARPRILLTSLAAA
jgi:hypothetical protein